MTMIFGHVGSILRNTGPFWQGLAKLFSRFEMKERELSYNSIHLSTVYLDSKDTNFLLKLGLSIGTRTKSSSASSSPSTLDYV